MVLPDQTGSMFTADSAGSDITDIRRYGWGEPVSREELSGRIRRLSEWADEIRRDVLATYE